jgi:hypothetical protein
MALLILYDCGGGNGPSAYRIGLFRLPRLQQACGHMRTYLVLAAVTAGRMERILTDVHRKLSEFGPQLGCLFNDDLISSLYQVYLSLHIGPVPCYLAIFV